VTQSISSAAMGGLPQHEDQPLQLRFVNVRRNFNLTAAGKEIRIVQGLRRPGNQALDAPASTDIVPRDGSVFLRATR
jgi:hypothetical protein